LFLEKTMQIFSSSGGTEKLFTLIKRARDKLPAFHFLACLTACGK